MQKQCKHCGLGMLFVQRMTRQYCNQVCKQRAYRSSLKSWNLAQATNPDPAQVGELQRMDEFMKSLMKRTFGN